jgi:hypothetical protein
MRDYRRYLERDRRGFYTPKCLEVGVLGSTQVRHSQKFGEMIRLGWMHLLLGGRPFPSKLNYYGEKPLRISLKTSVTFSSPR